LIAFAHGCSYRKRIEEWLATANVTPQRVLEFASYQAIIACVAAGTGFAVVPKSVLADLRSSKNIRQHDLPRKFALSRTHLVWSGEASPALNGLISLSSNPR
jgi:DNA-binding transcriptional LysR family regulator